MTNGGGAVLDELRRRAKEIRALTVQMAHDGNSPHVGSALSSVDLLVTLFFRCLHLDPALDRGDRDRFILSKGHGCISYYATLSEAGYFPKSLLGTYARNGSSLAEHPGPSCVPGIEIGTGSLGHGLSVACGAALARKIDRRPGREVVLLSDGECNEGSVWEAAMFAAGHDLDNLVAIIDHNGLQAMGRCDEIAGAAPLGAKWKAFGWAVCEIDGHSVEAIASTLESLPFEPHRPSAVIAHTVKGKGVSFMENDLEWHYRPPGDKDLADALLEIERS